MKGKIDFKDKITIDDLNENQYRVRRNLLILPTIGTFSWFLVDISSR